jgi:hypothetical protein
MPDDRLDQCDRHATASPRGVNDQRPDQALPDQRPVADEEAAEPSAPPRDQALSIPRRGGEEVATDAVADGAVDRRQRRQVDIVRWGDDNRLVAGGHDVGVGPPSERSFVHTSIFAHRVGPESASPSDGAWLGRACRAPEGKQRRAGSAFGRSHQTRPPPEGSDDETSRGPPFR